MQARLIRISTVAVSILLLAVSVGATDFSYSIGADGGAILLTGGDFFSFDQPGHYGFHLGHQPGNRWLVDLGYAAFKFSNDTKQDSTSSIGTLSNNSPLDFEATRISLMLGRLLFSPERRLNIALTLGGGFLAWQGINPSTNTTYQVKGEKTDATDFGGTELILSSSAALVITPVPTWSANLHARADYLTGTGVEFESAIQTARDHWLLGIGGGFSFHFGHREKQPRRWSNEKTSGETQAPQIRNPSRDSDNDGVPDDVDQCTNTPPGAPVDRVGCPVDTDGDGVTDGFDDCPATSTKARGTVDIHGCPVDSDLDGIPDYKDTCPDNPVGAQVDSIGCPIDSDSDGVPDGLDDCPYTLVGVAVDHYGCIDLSMLSKPMVLNIDYVPGSFEVDPINKERVKRLAGLLNFVKDIKLEINGYTDNIGTPVANKKLSEKRANRVRYYLEMYGVEPERMKVFGRGETNFVASNQTAEGRAKNRRIEIVFYK